EVMSLDTPGMVDIELCIGEKEDQQRRPGQQGPLGVPRVRAGIQFPRCPALATAGLPRQSEPSMLPAEWVLPTYTRPSITDRNVRVSGFLPQEDATPLYRVAFQMAEVAIPRQMFQEILRLIAELRPQPPPALACGVRWSCGQGNRREESVQMRRKMARSAPPPPFGPPGVAAVAAPPAWLARTRERRKNSCHFRSHPRNPGLFTAPKPGVRLADPCARSRTRSPHAARPPPGRGRYEAMGGQVGTANRSVLKL